MKRILTVLILLSGAGAARAVPVVPNFTQGSMTSHTETTSTVTETINSMDYNTGWQYVVTGTNIDAAGDLTPTGAGSVNATQVTLDGVTSTWNGLNLNDRPNYTLTTPGAAFQFTESYQGPGLSNHTVIQRTTTINSVTDTTSTFTQ
jgi:hypothetical protein|tara:strand:- start:630 stop:1070 length:441 start_codon:yes stop_codon:yes gene_type:complete